MTSAKLVDRIVTRFALPLVIVLAALLVATASYAQATAPEDETRLVINRKPQSIAIYIAMPADLLPKRFGGIPEELQPGPDGLDIETLRDGTIGVVDWMIARSDARIDGVPATLEPLSAMVHPDTLDLPFSNPRDASIATAVCTAPPSGPLGLDALTLYSGVFLYPIDGTAQLDVRLAGLAADANVSVANFWDWELYDQREVTGDADGWFDPGPAPRLPAFVELRGVILALVAGLLIGAGVFALIGRMQKRPASAEASQS